MQGLYRTLIKKKLIKSFLINSRISPKSFNKWKYLRGFFIKITSAFDEIYAQSQLDKKRLEFLTKRKINFIGNLKLSSIEKSNDKIELNKFQKKINDYQIIMLASTHEGEEKILINFIKKEDLCRRYFTFIICCKRNVVINVVDCSYSACENIIKTMFRDTSCC